jgi:hypothetical protein
MATVQAAAAAAAASAETTTLVDTTATQPPALTSLLRQLSVEAATGHIDYDSKMAIKTTLLNEASQAVGSSTSVTFDDEPEPGSRNVNRYDGPLAELYFALEIANRSGVIKQSTHEHVTHLLHSSHSIVPLIPPPSSSTPSSSSHSGRGSKTVRWSNLSADVFSLLFSLMDGMCSLSSSRCR